MALWEYKHITSGPHGFATAALLETHLNQLGKDEWEIIHFQTLPNNPLAFNGLARRSTLRDWTLEQAAAAAAKAEAEKLRAEFAAKFQAGTSGQAADSAPEKPASLVADTAAPDDGLRKVRDTERDSDPDAPDEEGEDWDNWDNYDDDLPTFFEAIKPHLRKNQRGPGQAVGLDFLAKRWEQTEGDLIKALQECGFTVPETEETPLDYLEFEGDLFWLNRSNRGQLFINTREKPRPVYRTAPAKKLDPADPVNAVLAEEAAAAAARPAQPEDRNERPERERGGDRERGERDRNDRGDRSSGRNDDRAEPGEASDGRKTFEPKARQPRPDAAPAQAADSSAPAPASAPAPQVAATGPLPSGEELLAALRPMMRRNRRGPGWSGSTSFLARALKRPEADLVAALGAMNLVCAEQPNEKPALTEIGDYVYWLNKDSRGGLWINGYEKRDRAAATTSANESAAAGAAASAGETAPAAVAAPASPAGETAPVPAAELPAPAVDAAPARVPEHPDETVFPFTPPAPAPVAENASAPEAPAAPVDEAPRSSSAGASPLTALRLLLKPNKRGTGVSGEVGFLARTLEKSDAEFTAALTALGLQLPATADDKPTFVEHDGEVFWLNQNPKDGSVWLNAKPSRAATGKKPPTGNPRARPPRRSPPKES